MKIEIRADGAHISGYVNVTEKKSRPVMTPRGRVVEEIEPRAFQGALDRADNIPMTKDHDTQVLAETRSGGLKLYEDNIGLHYEAIITDEQTVSEARAGKVKGLSFGMKNVVDTIEERTNDLPLRKITALDLDHVTLVVKKSPVYSATSIEIRADSEIYLETRTIEESPKITEDKPIVAPFFDNTAYKNRIAAISGQKQED